MKRVLFVCLGNSCRSQMAEGFARRYGSDVLTAQSAGLAPAAIVAPDTLRSMAEKNIDLKDHFPKALIEFRSSNFDIVVNMSGYPLPKSIANVRVWAVRDPIGERNEVYADVRDHIENLVMQLVLELRREAGPS